MPNLKSNTTNNFGISEEVIALITNVFNKFPTIKEVKIFGSRAMGNYKPGSDIDLAIFSDSLTHNDLLDILQELEDLELLYEIDCLDYNKTKEPALKEHINHVGITFYKAV